MREQRCSRRCGPFPAAPVPRIRCVQGTHGAAFLATVSALPPTTPALRWQCAELGVGVEATAADEADMWEDDYLDVVAEGDDPWGRSAFDPAAVTPPASLAPPPPSAYSAEGGFTTLSPLQLAHALAAPSQPLVVDLRDAAEFVDCHVPGALHCPFEGLSAAVRAGALGSSSSGGGGGVVLVCATGQRAAQAAVRLRRVFGFHRVAALAGGMAAYVVEEGLPRSRGFS